MVQYFQIIKVFTDVCIYLLQCIMTFIDFMSLVSLCNCNIRFLNGLSDIFV